MKFEDGGGKLDMKASAESCPLYVLCLKFYALQLTSIHMVGRADEVASACCHASAS